MYSIHIILHPSESGHYTFMGEKVPFSLRHISHMCTADKLQEIISSLNMNEIMELYVDYFKSA